MTGDLRQLPLHITTSLNCVSVVIIEFLAFDEFPCFFIVSVICFSPDAILVKCNGAELTADYFTKKGFKKPILVEAKGELGLVVPDSSFSILEVQKHVGAYCILVYLFPSFSTLLGFFILMICSYCNFFVLRWRLCI